MKISYLERTLTVDEKGIIEGNPAHTFLDGTVYFHNRPEGQAEVIREKPTTASIIEHLKVIFQDGNWSEIAGLVPELYEIKKEVEGL